MKTFTALPASGAVLAITMLAIPAQAQTYTPPNSVPAPTVRIPPPAPPAPPRPADGARPPVPATSPGTWVTPDDYPLQALLDEVEGRTAFRLEVDASGRVTRCTVMESSGSSALDERTCERLERRARFTPATDSRGRNVAGVYASAVRWVMPPREPVPEEVNVEVSYVIDETGNISDCQIVSADIPAGAPPVECTNGSDFLPLRDADGNPIRRRVRQRLQVIYEPVD